MTKTLKKSLLITFITLFGAVAALFAVSLLPSANSASADETAEEDIEFHFDLFYEDKMESEGSFTFRIVTKKQNESFTVSELDTLFRKEGYTYTISRVANAPVVAVDITHKTALELKEEYNGDLAFAVVYSEFEESKFILNFYDSDNTTIIKTLLGKWDELITEEMMNFTPPQKENATFSGWGYYTGAEYGEEIVFVGKTFGYIFDTTYNPLSEDILGFYPIFFDNDITITFLDTSTTQEIGSITKRYNAKIVENDIKFLFPSNPGVFFRFTSGSRSFDVSDFYKYTILELRYKIFGVGEIVFELYTFTISIIDCNDPPELMNDYSSENYYPKLPAKVIKADFAKEGYRIIGLSDTADSTTITPLTDITVTADKTYYVRYQKIQTLSIIDGDKTETAEVPADTPLFIKNYLSADKFKREGYIFKGFALTDGGEVAYTLDTTTIMITADTTLYAVYVKALTVSFMADGKVAFYSMIEPGKTIDLSGAGIHSILEKPGYTLKGFATEENGEIVYSETDIITPETDMTLYAVYEEVKTPGGDENPGNIGDKVNDVSNKISEWIKGKTGIALSSSAVIVLAVVFAIVLFKRK